MPGGGGGDDDKERKRKKQTKRMGKILGKLWDLDANFQDDSSSHTNSSSTAAATTVCCLTDVGQRIDQGHYNKVGRHGWEDFSRDVGRVYQRHIQGKTILAAAAKKHLKVVQQLLDEVHESLGKLSTERLVDDWTTNGTTTATATSNSNSNDHHKRKTSDVDTSAGPSSAQKKAKPNATATLTTRSDNANAELAMREDRAMEQLIAFLVERGLKADAVAGFRARVTRKGVSTTRFDVNYYNSSNRRFRSMMEVGRFFHIVNDTTEQQQGSGGGFGARVNGASKLSRRKVTGGKDQEAEKKRLRKELERLRKTQQRARKNLEASQATRDASSSLRYPVDDRLVLLPVSAAAAEPHKATSCAEAAGGTSGVMSEAARKSSAAARCPDLTGFPGIPVHCTPDILMVWDFLCTFERALSLTPVALDDFASALVYVPPDGQAGDDVLVPPVYLAEAHLGLLKLLFADKSSDEWWWSVLETEETEVIKVMDDVVKEDADRPVIRVCNMAAALSEVEDPLITASWMSSLDKATDMSAKKDLVKNAIRSALKLTTNKYIAAYLRKSLNVCKVSGLGLTQQALRWLLRWVREARPDLGEKATKEDAVFQARSRVVEEVGRQMESLGVTAPAVNDADVVSDIEYDEDESDESDDDEDDKPDTNAFGKDTLNESERHASALPPKPTPTLVDLLLPPTKPLFNSEFVDAFSWSHIVGAAATRILHRKKRILNEIDDHIRESNALPRLLISERREREKVAVSRILTECEDGEHSPLEKSTLHLCDGGNYLDLSSVERLSLLRLLIEASYDTGRVYEVVSGNYKQRTSAMKALEVEQRRSKREAKEKATSDEAAARERLSSDAREQFLDEKREEIRQLNARSKEFSDDVMDSLTDEDIIDFDDDIRADYDALPAPDSFIEAEVTRMVTRMQEEAAFETNALCVLTKEELFEKEERELEELEGQFSGFGGEDALVDDSLDRETARTLDRLRRDVERARAQTSTLPDLRAKALTQLKDAMDDGRIIVLRAAYNAGKKAKLMGTDDETGGVWAVDLMRDAGLELEKAKQNKRVLDAQRDLVAKRNKCFIRTEPLGHDRFGNRFWTLSKRKDDSHEEDGRVWVETEFILSQSDGDQENPPSGFVDLHKDYQLVSFGAPDMEEDWLPKDSRESFRLFSRREYHSTGSTPTLMKLHWGCHSTETSLRAVIKSLSSKIIRESELKTKLKQLLEETLGSDEGEKHAAHGVSSDEADLRDEPEANRLRYDGDEAVFIEAKDAASSVDDVDYTAFETLYSGIGAVLRVQHIVDSSKEFPISRYENGVVNAWKFRVLTAEATDDNEQRTPSEVPVWRVISERGHIFWLLGGELMESISRYKKWTQGQGYFENDSAFFSYRNSLGRFCGKASEAAYSSSPYYFAKLMLKKEAELYPKLKSRNYDNSWGGQSGARAQWTNSMKDYAYDFQTVKQGLVTLENAMFELTGEFADYTTVDSPGDIEALLSNPQAVFDIELESMEKNLPGLWNTATSRAVFLHIVEKSKTTGFLSLALDLLCRNTFKYMQTHNLLNVRVGERDIDDPTISTSRTTRRRNAWQQQQNSW